MKARMNAYFEPSLLQRVEDLAARKGLTKSTIIEAAVASFLSPDAEDRREAAFARRLDRFHRLACGVGADVEHPDIHTFRSQAQRDRPPDSAAGPGDDGGLALESSHACSPDKRG